MIITITQEMITQAHEEALRRENYISHHFDIKTETFPNSIYQSLRNDQIDDDRPYGRRLINQNQYPLLNNYDWVFFSCFNRDNIDTSNPNTLDIDEWLFLGALSAEYILQNYTPTTSNPFGTNYPFPAAPVRQSDLTTLDQFRDEVEQ